jgi:uncharacterized Tic20 family protein
VSSDLPANEPPTQDDRIMAALAHVSILLPFTGLIAPIIIWATQKSKSPYVRFQALQAVAYHLTMIVAGFVGGACYFCSFFIFFPLLMLSTPENSNGSALPAPVVGGALLSVFLPFLVFGIVAVGLVAFVLTGIFGAVRTLQGKPFRYPILGRRLERYLEATPAAQQSSS